MVIILLVLVNIEFRETCSYVVKFKNYDLYLFNDVLSFEGIVKLESGI